MSESSKYYPSNPDEALSNADARVAIGEIVGFDYTKRLEDRHSTSRHAIYFRVGEVVAILNYLRFNTDERPEPVCSFSKDALVSELASRCGFRQRSNRLERIELQAVLETLHDISTEAQ